MGFGRIVRASARAAIVTAVLLIALVAIPSLAHAATWTNQYPFGAVHVKPTNVTVDVFGSAVLSASTAKMTVGGVSQKTYVTNVAAATGHWEYSEVQDPVTGVWTARWAWVADPPGTTKATIYCYPTGLTEGAKAVTVTVKDVNGNTLSYDWSFTFGIPPVIGTPTPADGSTVSTLTPTISVPVSDNTGVTSWNVSIGGVPGTASLANGVLRIVPGAPLVNDAVNLVALTVYDAGGNSASRSWSYYAQTYPTMGGSYADCVSCHIGYDTNHRGPYCVECHAEPIQAPPHNGEPADLHTRALLGSECSGCHVSALLSEHARYDVDCLDCHTSTDAAVIAAIGSKNSNCSACHGEITVLSHYDSVDHTATPDPADIQISGTDFGTHACSECHSMRLGDSHKKQDGSPDCAKCHPTPRNTFMTWNFGCVQEGCHGTTSTKPMHAEIDSAHVLPAFIDACTGAGCHDAAAITPFVGKSLADLHSEASTTVAGVERSSCQICHAEGVTPTDNCLTSGCHADRANAHGYDAVTHTGNPTAQTFTIDGASYPAVACASCHSLELGIEHTKPTSAGNTGCSECHQTLYNQIKPWDRTTCAQAACHTLSSAAPMHADITPAHARLGANDACFASGCHADGSLAAIHSQAATTVAGVERTGCMVCHADGVPTSKDCTTCHADKVASHYSPAQHTATMGSGDFTILGTDFGTRPCSECHPSTDLSTNHVSTGEGCATCHPTAADAASPWDDTCASSGCHAAGTTKPMHAEIDSAHVLPAFIDACTGAGCHDAAAITPFVGKSLADLHSEASTTVAGVERSSCQICHAEGVTPTDNCLTSGCHADRANAHGYDAVTHTGNPTAQTFTIDGASYPAVACASCHSLELGIEHTKPTSAGNTGCSECHQTLYNQIKPWDRTTCAQAACHTLSSAAPMHADITPAHARLGANDACFASGCHADGSLAAIHSQAATTVAGVERTGCMVCHADGVPTSKDCTTCHADKVASHYSPAQHTATMGSGDFTILGTDFGTRPCSECHPSTDLSTNHVSTGEGCATCHPTAADAASPWDDTCASSGCHAAGTTKPMHAEIDSAHVIGASSCTAADCHAGGANVAAVHSQATTTVAGVELSSCEICHAPGRTPTTNCTTCHATSPHTAVHDAGVTGGTITFFDASAQHSLSEDCPPIDVNVGCSMCHGEMNLLSLHNNACALCHAGTSPPADSFGTWDGGCSQGACHVTYHDTASSGHDGVYVDDISSGEYRVHLPPVCRLHRRQPHRRHRGVVRELPLVQGHLASQYDRERAAVLRRHRVGHLHRHRRQGRRGDLLRARRRRARAGLGRAARPGVGHPPRLAHPRVLVGGRLGQRGDPPRQRDVRRHPRHPRPDHDLGRRGDLLGGRRDPSERAR